jgi:hypothetical protein
VTEDGSPVSSYSLTISGLAFTPRVIIASCNTTRNVTLYQNYVTEYNNTIGIPNMIVFQYVKSQTSFQITPIRSTASPAQVGSTCVLPVYSPGQNYSWIAIE